MAVRVLLTGSPSELKEDAASNYAILAKTQVPINIMNGRYELGVVMGVIDGAAWIVDALLGTGATGDARPPMDEIIELLKRNSGA